MGTVRVGDELLDENGTPTKILAVSDTVTPKPCYEITLASGEKIVTDPRHEWYVTRSVSWGRFDPRGQFDAPADRTREWLLRSALVNARQLYDHYNRENPPYVYLPLLTARPFGPPAKLSGEGYKAGKDYGSAPATVREGRATNYFPKRNRDLPKVPEDVYAKPLRWRYAFVKGMMDELATREGVRYVVYVRGPDVCNSIGRLLWSVGIRHRTTFVKEDRYKIWVRAEICPFTNRPAGDIGPGMPNRTPASSWMPIVGVRRVKGVPVRCVQVDSPSHCYLAGHTQVPTHNSSALLMAALQFVHVPGYAAIILRRTFRDLNQPGALISRSMEWLTDTDAKWSSKHNRWTFPSGSTVSFGYIEHERDVFQYQGAEFQFVAFDECVEFSEFMYTYMFSRTRKTVGIDVPIRTRCASNPPTGSHQHAWPKERFISGAVRADRFFIPATVYDNPSLDVEEYVNALQNLDPVTRQRILNGDWEVSEEGQVFKKHWFRLVSPQEAPPLHEMKLVRSWDLAATEVSDQNKDPDYAVGTLFGRHPSSGGFYILDVDRFRANAGAVKRRIGDVALRDGRQVPIRFEQEPGSSGKMVIDDLVRTLIGYDVRGIRSSGDKVTRAGPLASAAEAGLIHVARAPWTEAWLQEYSQFGPNAPHDDQVDSGTLGFLDLTAGLRPWTAEDVRKVFAGRRERALERNPTNVMDRIRGLANTKRVKSRIIR